MVVVMLIVHVTLWAHANAVAQAAAEHGAEVAAAFQADAEEARQAAVDFVLQAGQVNDPVAVVTSGVDEVTVTVTGTYPSVFGSLEVEATSTLVLERIDRP